MLAWLFVPSGGVVCEGESNDARSNQSARTIAIPVISASVILIGLFLPLGAAASPAEPAEIFQARCSVCHTVGLGDKIGPDLFGVHERRDGAWLTAFIRSSQSVIASGDAVATDLFNQFSQRTMPDHDLEDAEIEALIAFIADGGPATTPTFRVASQASSTDVAMGRRLFYEGQEASAAGCGGCHSLANDEGMFTRTLGGSLGHVLSRYRDAELARCLEGPVAMAANGSCQRAPLDADSSFQLRAFLYQVDQNLIAAETSTFSLPKAGIAVALLLLLVVQLGSGWRPQLRSGRRRLAHSDRLS